MPSGACTIRRDGVRGAVWYVKFTDADGRQVKERLGREDEGWTERKAQRELRHRLSDVEREGFAKPDGTTFATFAARWQSEYLPSRGLKRSTTIAYDVDLRVHLVPWFGDLALAELERRPELVDRYVAAKRQTHSPKTVANTLGTLRLVLATAVRWRLIRSNPVLLAERPRLNPPEMQVLREGRSRRSSPPTANSRSTRPSTSGHGGAWCGVSSWWRSGPLFGVVSCSASPGATSRSSTGG